LFTIGLLDVSSHNRFIRRFQSIHRFRRKHCTQREYLFTNNYESL